jgi:hypothetical protein
MGVQIAQLKGMATSSAIGSATARPPDLYLRTSVDRMMNGLFMMEAHQADFVVRIPLDRVLGVPFPLGGDHYDIAASRPAVEITFKALAHGSQALGKQLCLVPSNSAGLLALLLDRS